MDFNTSMYVVQQKRAFQKPFVGIAVKERARKIDSWIDRKREREREREIERERE